MSGLVYSNARVKVKEKELLTQTQIERLEKSQSLEESFRLLVEFGYHSENVDHLDFDALFDAEDRKATLVLKELGADDSALRVFLMQNDFHNLKVAFKARESKRKSENEPFMVDGLQSAELIKKSVEKNSYSTLLNEMQEVALEIEKAKEDDKLTSRYIDVSIDKAMYKTIFAIVKKSKRKELIDYWTKSADVANISSFLRVARLSLPNSVFDEAFIEGGLLEFDFFAKLLGKEIEEFAAKLNYTSYSMLSPYLSGSISKFEVECDNLLLRVFKSQKHDMFSLSPIVGFYLGKKTEVKTVKLIISGQKNKINQSIIAERMREIYA